MSLIAVCDACGAKRILERKDGTDRLPNGWREFGLDDAVYHGCQPECFRAVTETIALMAPTPDQPIALPVVQELETCVDDRTPADGTEIMLRPYP